MTAAQPFFDSATTKFTALEPHCTAQPSCSSTCGIEDAARSVLIPNSNRRIDLAGDAFRLGLFESLHKRLLAMIDKLIESDPQAAEGGSHQWPEQQLIYQRLATLPHLGAAPTICEIGFNAGSSALLWLVAQPSARVYFFDLGIHRGVDAAYRWLVEEPALNASGRLHLIRGPSNETVPRFHANHPHVRCNLLSIDGGHERPVAQGDLENFQMLADGCCHIGLIDDCPLATTSRTSYTQGVIGAFHHFQRAKRVCSLFTAVRETSQELGSLRGLTVFRYKS